MLELAMLTISVEDYRPSTALDDELAELAFAAIQAWPDHTPVDGARVRSMLRSAGMTATTLALHRDGDGRLVAAVAVRWPATLDAAGRLWGPLVHPDAVGRGLGRTLMGSVAEMMAARPGVLVSSTDVPESRRDGWGLYEQAGWEQSGRLDLLERPLGDDLPEPAGGQPGVRALRSGDYVAPALADLFAANNPGAAWSDARDTFSRWSQDARYRPECLLLAGDDARLAGAALVFPSPSTRPDEPAQALLAEILIAPELDAAAAEATRQALVAAALRAAAAAGASLARAVVDDPALVAALHGAGFTVVDQIRRYSHKVERTA
jgi:ribosomal protein S18 acetylase RimI-like enzyme